MYVHIPKQKRLKWDSKADRGIHVDYGDETKGYRIWYSNRNKVQRDVIFEEGEDRHKTTEEDKIERSWTEVHEKPAEEAEEDEESEKEIRKSGRRGRRSRSKC